MTMSTLKGPNKGKYFIDRCSQLEDAWSAEADQNKSYGPLTGVTVVPIGN